MQRVRAGMMEYLNHTNVHVLYGGISSWYRDPPFGAGYETDSTWANEPNDGTFVARERQDLRATKVEIETAISKCAVNARCAINLRDTV
eukprot:COSAG01_NODE_3362_length_6198_cov_2.602394_8_plen_89_part_00